jgi:hypothetical protein
VANHTCNRNEFGNVLDNSAIPNCYGGNVSCINNVNSAIALIKLVREHTHCGLKEAKDAVDAIFTKHREDWLSRNPQPSVSSAVLDDYYNARRAVDDHATKVDAAYDVYSRLRSENDALYDQYNAARRKLTGKDNY